MLESARQKIPVPFSKAHVLFILRPRMRRLIFVFLSLAVLTSPAHAELVATTFHAVTEQDMLIVELSDIQRPSAQKTPSTCERAGMRMVLISATSNAIFPRVMSYASGCWYYADGNVYIQARTVRDDKNFELSYAAAEFKTTKQFSNWLDYRHQNSADQAYTTSWYVIADGAKTAETGCIAQPGKSADDILAELSANLVDIEMVSKDNMRTADGEPVIYVTGKNPKTKEMESLSASTLNGCVESLAQHEATIHFDRYEIVDEIPEYLDRLNDNLRRLKAGQAIVDYKRMTSDKPIKGYVSNQVGQTAYLYETDCHDGSGKQAQEVTDKPRMLTGCWYRDGNVIVVEWQTYIEHGLMRHLQKGEYKSVFNLPD